MCANKLDKSKNGAGTVVNTELGIFGTVCRFDGRLPWKADFIHIATASEKYWKDIDFLDAKCVGDSKVT